jgi:competence protein CoiA
MQLFAWTEKQEIIEASQAERKKDYNCMECGGAVRVRQGEFRRSHFYHYKETPGCRQAGKSLEHLQTQIYLKEALTGEVFLEKRFDSINRIADVVWENEKIIFEVQCSPILAQEVMQRNRDYQSCGYNVIWIMHDKRYAGKRMTSAEHYLLRSPHYYTNIDQDGNGQVYDRLWGRCEKVAVEFELVPIKRFTKPAYPMKLRASKWQFRLKGDLFDHAFADIWPKRESLLQRFKRMYRIILQTALENASR